MAITTGTVLSVTYVGNVVCARIGPSTSMTEVLFIAFAATDSAPARTFKRAMSVSLAQACQRGFPVEAEHANDGAEITSLSVLSGSISPVGPIVQDDFLGISANGVPAGAVAVFTSAATIVTVTPDLVRPHWVLIARLPTAVPVGRCTLRLQAPGWSTDAVPVDVTSGPRARVRSLYPGAPKTAPYAIAFVADPAIEVEVGGSFTADPVLSDRPAYHAFVAYCLQNLLTVTEEVLRQNDMDRNFRLVSIFDETRTPSAATSLVHEIAPNLMETRRAQLAGFLSGYGAEADVVMIAHGSTTHDRATAWFTSDDTARAGTAFTYDGVARAHRHFWTVPGSAAIPTSVDTTGLTPLHEFGTPARTSPTAW